MTDITISSFLLKKNALVAIGTPTFEQWVTAGEFIRNATGAVHFWIGDWLNYGERAYGNKYTEAIKKTGYDYQTLANDKWVASKIEISRRRENLSFDHHVNVADLTPEEQEEMLSKAVENNLPRQEFRQTVKDYKDRLDLPELADADFVNTPEKELDFDKAKRIISISVDLVTSLKEIDLSKLNPDAKLFLFSELKKTIGILGNIVLNDRS